MSGLRVPIAGVKKVLAVASAKGGVGKSTVAVNIAVSLGLLGKKSGILDLDVYGPSVHKMLGLSGKPSVGDDKKIIPITRHGISAMSMGVLMNEGVPVIWRGPMVASAVQQLFDSIKWDGLDTLILDLPPGTGDTQLTMAQSIEVDGALIVTTPQEVCLSDVRRGLSMFKNMKVPILGVVENMAGITCPHCKGNIDVFGTGKVEKAMKELDVSIIGKIPLDPEVSNTSDEGSPICLTKSNSASIFRDIAKNIIDLLG